MGTHTANINSNTNSTFIHGLGCELIKNVRPAESHSTQNPEPPERERQREYTVSKNAAPLSMYTHTNTFIILLSRHGPANWMQFNVYQLHTDGSGARVMGSRMNVIMRIIVE